MSTNSSTMIIEFAKSTQNVSLCLALSVLAIAVFMLTPLSSLDKFLMSSIIGKILVLSLLGYTMYYNIIQTNNISNNYNVSLTSGNWNALKTNIACSYIFSAFLLILMLSVIRRML
jgi:hypothetical protein